MTRLLFFLVFGTATLLQAQTKTPVHQLILDSVEFEEADLPSVLQYLGIKARELNGTPANFLLYDPTGELRKTDPKVSLSLRNVPLSQVVKYVGDTTGTTLMIDTHGVMIGTKADLAGLKTLRAKRPIPPSNNAQLKELGSAKIPEFSIADADLGTGIEFLRMKAWELCSKDAPPNFVIKAHELENPASRPLTMEMGDVSLLTVLQYMTELTNTSLRFDPRAIVIASPENLQSGKPQIAGRNPHFTLIQSSQIEELSIEEAPLTELLPVVSHYAKGLVAPDGPNFVSLAKSQRTATLHLRKVRTIDLFRYVTECTGTNFRVEPNVISIFDLPAPKPKPPADSK